MHLYFKTTPISFPFHRLPSIIGWAAVLLLTCDLAWSATLIWTPNIEPDLAGYRVYQCTSQPCGRTYGTATLLVTLGTVASFNIGTPSATRYYVVTAIDTANNESADSAVAIYSPVTSPSPTPVISAAPRTVSFTAQQGSSDPPAQLLTISNTGGGAFTWTVSENTNWLTLTPSSGSGNSTATMRAMVGTLAVGTYSGAITVRANGALDVVVPVTLTITNIPMVPPPTPTGLQVSSQ